MRRAIFIFIAIILVAVSIDWNDACAELKPHKEGFGRQIIYAEMYEYKDKDYDYVVRVPSFFNAQPDSLQEEKGRMRFDYADQWITLVIESHVMNSGGMSLQAGMDSLAQILNATEHRLGSDYFILSGPQYERTEQKLCQNETFLPQTLKLFSDCYPRLPFFWFHRGFFV